MTDVYAAYGPLPSSLGVTPSPPPEIYESCDEVLSDGRRHKRSATLGKPNEFHRHRKSARSQQDLRRSISRNAIERHHEHDMRRSVSKATIDRAPEIIRRSRAALERTPEPLQLLETLDSLDSTAARLRGSLQKLDSPIYSERRNGSVVSVNSYKVDAYGQKSDDIIIENRCCFHSTCCKVFLSIIACILILCGIVMALYYFLEHVPYEPKESTKLETIDQCLNVNCQYGSICVPTPGGLGQCQCPTDCSSYGSSLESSMVCASDGKNYENQCDLLKTICYHRTPLTLKYKGKCDPCEDVSCPDKQICQLDRDRRPMCRCNDVCNREFDPVCASDGKTYMNECVMKVEGCKRRRPLAIIYRGECSGEVNPCGSKVCLAGEECNIDIFGIARCECPPLCEPAVRPVCGTDNITYDSECNLRRKVCFKQENVNISYVGVCGERGPCVNHPCGFGAVCIERNNKAECKCEDCPSELDPVCASDGLSYDNECLLKSEACKQHRSIAIRYRGKCSGCEDKVCNFYGVCEADENSHGKCVCPEICSNADNPVCGTDGITYTNECYLKIASCKQQKLIVVASRGDCDLCKHVVCKYGARCESGECICPTSCHTTREPVCASNGVTYLNECEMQKASCRMGRGSLRVVFFGECAEAARSSGITGNDPCTIMSCDYGSTCIVKADGLPRCSCTLDCTDAPKDPVCASDLKMYPNECTMNREACQRQVELRLRPLELCEDYELVPCNGASPLLNPMTGRDFYCGEGPDKEDCPQGAYCHWSLSFAKCCPMNDDVNITLTGPSCKSSHFGCCPDSTTTALGPNYAGCPSICQCHKLGAHEETCDPVTNQCRCKPGVGGTKCDRCEPGYWGLPEIQYGSKGCQPCACSLFGSARDDCEQMTGQCVCKPGIGGKKCNLCPEGLILGPKGCSREKHQPEDSPQSCETLECYFGAKCHIRDGHAECLCDAQCPSDASSATPVCGSDGETYGSECHLKLFACRYQKDVVVDALGPCPPLGNQSDGVTESPNRRSTAPLSTETHSKSTRHLEHLLPEYFLLKGKLQPTPVSFRVFGLLGSLCYRDKDCSVAYSHCEGSLCVCKKGLSPNYEQQRCSATSSNNIVNYSPCENSPCKYGGTCKPLPAASFTCICHSENTGSLCEIFIKPPYKTPAFSGASYMELRKIKAYNKVQIEIEFRSYEENGILIYSQQKTDGSGDFISLAIVDGYVEFRYNLGSGPVIIRSHHVISSNDFHKVVAKRYQRDGMLNLDEYEPSIGQTPGHLKSLDLRGATYLGYVANSTQRVWENIGTSSGLVGCVRALRVNGRPIDLLWPSSPHVTSKHDIEECSSTPCFKMPCLNEGICHVLDSREYKCTCINGYFGKNCEYRKSPCENKPCLSGGTCLPLPSTGFVCKCPPGRTGSLCESMDRSLREIVVPEFTGDSYLEFPTLQSVGKSFAIEIWFLPKKVDGVLLYNSQAKESGDFVSVNLKDGHVEFTYSLGTGLAKLISREKVELNVWQVVKAQRKKRKGILQLGTGKRIRGKSGPRLSQLNLELPLYIGGVRNLNETHTDARIMTGFSGAVQRIILNTQVIEDLGAVANEGHAIKRYIGAPCIFSPCKNEGICQAYLNRFFCKCTTEFYGKFCERKHTRETVNPISFDGATYLQFTPLVYTVNYTSQNQSISDYWDHSFPQPWNLLDLAYPSDYDDIIGYDYFFVEQEEDYYDEEDESDVEDKDIRKSDRLNALSKVAESLPQILLNDKVYDIIKNDGSDSSEEDYSEKSQSTNHFKVRLRALSGEGLIVWMGKGSSLKKDYIAIALSSGLIQVSFNLGKEHNLLSALSTVKVDDGKWHTVIVQRRKSICVLKVDDEAPVRIVAEKGTKYLNANGKLWIGGTSQLPEGLPSSYYLGFKGCIESLEVEHRLLDLRTHEDSNELQFCNSIT